MQLVKSPHAAKRIGDRDSQRLFVIEFNLRTLDFQQSPERIDRYTGARLNMGGYGWSIKGIAPA